MKTTIRMALGIVSACFMLGGTLLACNIPVFRYALERWKPDSCEVIVFQDQELVPEQWHKLEGLGLGPFTMPPGGDAVDGTGAAARMPGRPVPANLSLVLVHVGETIEPRYRDLWLTIQAAGKVALPYVVVRTSVSDKQAVNAWHGPLEKFPAKGIVDSPVRQELSKRLLRGDSVVWLILKSKNAERNAAVKSLLDKELKQLSRDIPFPDGLGLPGSELFAELPLLMQFTVLEIDPQQAKEEFLTGLFQGFQPEAVKEDQPLVVPVFGRGRALEVLPADRLDAGMVGDLTRYLCGACSCQVKERNPGFDLVLSTQWDRELFGEGDLPPPPKEYDPNQAPTYIPIPSGKSPK